MPTVTYFYDSARWASRQKKRSPEFWSAGYRYAYYDRSCRGTLRISWVESNFEATRRPSRCFCEPPGNQFALVARDALESWQAFRI